MIMSPTLRRIAFTLHVVLSVGWLGAVIAYLALAVAAFGSSTPAKARSAWLSMETIGWYVLVPLALAAFASGLAISLGTKWGLFRHYWVVFKLALTIVATAILILHMPAVSQLANIAAAANDAEIRSMPSELLHPGAGLVVLLVITILRIYKPKGLTPYGWRKLEE